MFEGEINSIFSNSREDDNDLMSQYADNDSESIYGGNSTPSSGHSSIYSEGGHSSIEGSFASRENESSMTSIFTADLHSTGAKSSDITGMNSNNQVESGSIYDTNQEGHMGGMYMDENNIANDFNVRASNYGGNSIVDKMRGIQANRLNNDTEGVSITEMYNDSSLDTRVGGGQYNVTISDIYSDEAKFKAYHGLYTDGKIDENENYQIDTETGQEANKNNGGVESVSDFNTKADYSKPSFEKESFSQTKDNSSLSTPNHEREEFNPINNSIQSGTSNSSSVYSSTHNLAAGAGVAATSIYDKVNNKPESSTNLSSEENNSELMQKNQFRNMSTIDAGESFSKPNQNSTPNQVNSSMIDSSNNNQSLNPTLVAATATSAAAIGAGSQINSQTQNNDLVNSYKSSQNESINNIAEEESALNMEQLAFNTGVISSVQNIASIHFNENQIRAHEHGESSFNPYMANNIASQQYQHKEMNTDFGHSPYLANELLNNGEESSLFLQNNTSEIAGIASTNESMRGYSNLRNQSSFNTNLSMEEKIENESLKATTQYEVMEHKQENFDQIDNSQLNISSNLEANSNIEVVSKEDSGQPNSNNMTTSVNSQESFNSSTENLAAAAISTSVISATQNKKEKDNIYIQEEDILGDNNLKEFKDKNPFESTFQSENIVDFNKYAEAKSENKTLEEKESSRDYSQMSLKELMKIKKDLKERVSVDNNSEFKDMSIEIELKKINKILVTKAY